MGQRHHFLCDRCGYSIDALDDGHPFHLHEKGHKLYAYSPDPYHEICTGVDEDHLCVARGCSFRRNLEGRATGCPECRSQEHFAVCDLEGRRCPFCTQGSFRYDREAERFD